MSIKLQVKSVQKVQKKNRSSARVSNDMHRSSRSHCCKRRDGAVEGIQEAGQDLADLFCQLRSPEQAARLVRAIRCRNRKVVEDLIGENCHVVCFFHQGRFACVRIACTFGECCDVRITFDICVSMGNCNTF
ncbi:hypothetical protein [Paenibacillus montanisoli]|uniref:Uncharacterized protein n=1 Tax=Paenibacillus montanisoli TaxID=2081970 RepID=A0A328TZB0_9BACL|nr:hypothetical protein [Paenibacillus montanisoli]RAP74481.1 hypothetical protein DL346_20650 [Paenibacillus montanisoli]